MTRTPFVFTRFFTAFAKTPNKIALFTFAFCAPPALSAFCCALVVDVSLPRLHQLTLANQDILGDIEPALKSAIQEDSEQFDRVIQARLLRDREKDTVKKRQLSEKALNELRIATEIPIRIAETCLALAEKAMLVFDLGYKAARGDSGVAISAAIAAASGCVSIIYLTSFRGGEWAVRTREKADELSRRTQDLQIQLVERIGHLQQEVIKREDQS